MVTQTSSLSSSANLDCPVDLSPSRKPPILLFSFSLSNLDILKIITDNYIEQTNWCVQDAFSPVGVYSVATWSEGPGFESGWSGFLYYFPQNLVKSSKICMYGYNEHAIHIAIINKWVLWYVKLVLTLILLPWWWLHRVSTLFNW